MEETFTISILPLPLSIPWCLLYTGVPLKQSRVRWSTVEGRDNSRPSPSPSKVLIFKCLAEKLRPIHYILIWALLILLLEALSITATETSELFCRASMISTHQPPQANLLLFGSWKCLLWNLSGKWVILSLFWASERPALLSPFYTAYFSVHNFVNLSLEFVLKSEYIF